MALLSAFAGGMPAVVAPAQAAVLGPAVFPVQAAVPGSAVAPAQVAGLGLAAAPALVAAPVIDAAIIADGVRLRSAPGGSYVIGLLYYGDYGQILSSSNGWCRFRLSGRSASGLPAGTTGWASCSYFATEDGLRLQNAPVDSLEAP